MLRLRDQDLKDALRALNVSAAQFNELAQTADKSKADLSSVESLTTEVGKSLSKLEPASKQIEASLTETARSAEQLLDKLGIEEKRLKELTNKQPTVDSQLSQVSDMIGAIMSVNGRVADSSQRIWENQQSLEKRMSEVTDTAKNAHEILSSAGANLQKLEDSGDATETASATLEHHLTALQEHSQTLTSRLQTVSNELRDKKTRDEKHLAELAENMRQAFENSTASAQDLLGRMQNELATNDEEHSANLKSYVEDLGRFNESLEQMRDLLDSYRKTAKDSRARTGESLTAKRLELQSSLEALGTLWNEALKEQAEMVSVADSAVNEIKMQREEQSSSSERLKSAVDKLVTERKGLSQELATFRTEREKRLRARTRGVCLSCGRKVTQNDIFCDRCGASIL